MTSRVTSSTPTPKTATRLPIINKQGVKLREGDRFKVTGRNNWWRFVAYVIPVGGGKSYIEAVELKEKGKAPPPKGRENLKNGAVRCIDIGKVREVG